MATTTSTVPFPFSMTTKISHFFACIASAWTHSTILFGLFLLLSALFRGYYASNVRDYKHGDKNSDDGDSDALGTMMPSS